ncbi:5-hydroxyisourate hydrolase [Microbacterium sp. cf046]|uniref:hydroxyisourate hydrolase n=1 Tax=Microbacterium sp. cf046 TaxID=1761803 RepID=UPI0008F1E786|nr:hydroxyisourate hydrolase [Microbacterium sp. cf046]SFR89097.1 5-hydroxyisourate hydrolase [Microbacterium sp. cf046]
MTSHLTTHVLDAATGTPAKNVVVSLARHMSGGGTTGVAQGFTDADGRLALGPEHLEPGMYALTFGTGAWFADRGIPTFYPLITVTFTVEESDRHYHVPLLLSPFAYSTYRGS